MKRPPMGKFMVQRTTLLAAVVAAAAAGTGAAAHHSVAGQFDMSEVITWTGVISNVDWINPHIYVHLDVADESGEVTTWMLETVPPAMMRRAGLSSAALIGDGATVQIEGLRARSEAAENLGYILKITYPDGRYYQLAQAPRT